MADLFKILDGIVADKEFRQENLSDVEMIQNYAEAMGQEISIKDAKRIQQVGKNWLQEQESGNGEWSRMRQDAMAALDE